MFQQSIATLIMNVRLRGVRLLLTLQEHSLLKPAVMTKMFEITETVTHRTGFRYKYFVIR